MVKFKLIASAVMALGVTTFAGASDVSTAAKVVNQNINVASTVNRTNNGGSAARQTSNGASSDTAIAEDNMADDSMTNFVAVIANVLAANDRSVDLADDLVDDSYNGDDRRYQDGGSRQQRHLKRHLGLGFAHGMGNDNPHNDECHGNGHLGNPDGKGKGHETRGNGNGFGHRDCGDPSPAD